MKLPKHKCGLHLTHNQHKDYYESIETYVTHDHFDWKSDEHKERAIATDEIWELQWYPETPVGFCCVAAPTLSECIAFALELSGESEFGPDISGDAEGVVG